MRADSPYQTLEDLLTALRADPLAFPVVGGQSDDRIFYGLLFSTAGIDPTKVNYIAFNGGAEASALLLEGSASAQISTVSEIGGLLDSGELRGLAFSGTERFEDALSYMPTLQEAGLDLEWQNFRYAMGGPDMPAEVVAFWQGVYAEMVTSSTWADVLQQNHWGDTFMIEGLDAYLDETQARVIDVAKTLGMAQ